MKEYRDYILIILAITSLVSFGTILERYKTKDQMGELRVKVYDARHDADVCKRELDNAEQALKGKGRYIYFSEAVKAMKIDYDYGGKK